MGVFRNGLQIFSPAKPGGFCHTVNICKEALMSKAYECCVNYNPCCAQARSARIIKKFAARGAENLKSFSY